MIHAHVRVPERLAVVAHQLVAQYGEQPRARCRFLLEILQPLHGREEGLLHQVLGQLRVAYALAGVAQKFDRVGIHPLRKLLPLLLLHHAQM